MVFMLISTFPKKLKPQKSIFVSQFMHNLILSIILYPYRLYRFVFNTICPKTTAEIFSISGLSSIQIYIDYTILRKILHMG